MNIKKRKKREKKEKQPFLPQGDMLGKSFFKLRIVTKSDYIISELNTLSRLVLQIFLTFLIP